MQPVRFCYHLLSADPTSFVSIEHLDDVAVQDKDGITLLEQTKSALTQNPVSDWSPELWKSIGNWIDAIEIDVTDVEQTRFILYVTPVHGGEIVHLLSSASTDLAADNAVKQIEAKLLAQKPKPKCASLVKRLVNMDPARRRAFIKNFQFESVHADPLEAIRKLVRVTVSDELVDTCCEHAIGRAKETADALIRAGTPPVVSAGAFRAEFHAFVRKFDFSGFLASITPTPTEKAVAKKLADAPMFVRQLEIVDASPEQKMSAVSAFLQAAADKTVWADAGKILPESIDELDSDLIKRHSLIRDEVEDTLKQLGKKARGRTIYNRCCVTQLKLEGREVPGHFVPGCYNALADRLRIGWHPSYERMLSGGPD